MNGVAMSRSAKKRHARIDAVSNNEDGKTKSPEVKCHLLSVFHANMSKLQDDMTIKARLILRYSMARIKWGLGYEQTKYRK